NEEARRLIPTAHLSYPLQQDGERFPFVAPLAKGFHPPDLTRTELFAANMEGVAYLERYAYELVEYLSGEKVKSIYTAGGGSRSHTWLTIRSSVLNLPIYKMKNVSGALGAAILAASLVGFSSLTAAARAMTQTEKKVLPEKNLAAEYEMNYRRFIALLGEKGYIRKETLHA
ncbi:MAG TPA: FGGY-family carbohydrate kinase, partial [Chryseosolibacter sp.]